MATTLRTVYTLIYTTRARALVPMIGFASKTTLEMQWDFYCIPLEGFISSALQTSRAHIVDH